MWPNQDKYLMDMDELFSQVDEKRKVSVNIILLWLLILSEHVTHFVFIIILFIHELGNTILDTHTHTFIVVYSYDLRFL